MQRPDSSSSSALVLNLLDLKAPHCPTENKPSFFPLHWASTSLQLRLVQSLLCLCRSSGPSAMACSSNPLAPLGFSFPPAPLQSSSTMASRGPLITMAPPLAKGPLVSSGLFGSTWVSTSTCSTSVVPLVPLGLSIKAPPWVLHPSAPPWAFNLLALFWGHSLAPPPSFPP